MQTLKQRIGKTLRYFREQQMSQTQFAYKSGTTNAAISVVERGKRGITLSRLEWYCKCLGIKLSDFFKHMEELE